LLDQLVGVVVRLPSRVQPFLPQAPQDVLPISTDAALCPRDSAYKLADVVGRVE
jgi:hypothetical protein